MGTWGIGVWQDDVAQDVVIRFQDIQKKGCSARTAVQRVLEDPPWGWDDEEDSARQVLAFAALALQHGVMEPSLRDRTIAAIELGGSLWSWESAQTEVIHARRKLLEHVKELVLNCSATDEDLSHVTTPKAYSL